MEQFASSLINLLTYVFTLIGLIASIYHAYKAWRSTNVLTWNKLDRQARKLIKKISCDDFIPDIIVTIGRGGAIIGAILSGNLAKKANESNIPFMGLERFYRWENGNRVEIDNNLLHYSTLKDRKVLLIAGDIITGETMSFYKSIIQPYASELRTACLLKSITTVFIPDYYAKEIAGDFKAPWMYKGFGYTKDSREPSNCVNRSWWEILTDRIK